MALNDLIVRQAKTTGKDYNLPDIDGLGLVVTATGGKLWQLLGVLAKIEARKAFTTAEKVRICTRCPRL
jgi:hypothetical protein